MKIQDFRLFAVLNDENVVVNTAMFPKNPPLIDKMIWKGPYIWIYDGTSWNSLNENESLNFGCRPEIINYVDSIEGDVQGYLNERFSNRATNDVVIDKGNFPDTITATLEVESILNCYTEPYKLKEYSLDQSITNNPAIIQSVYDEESNTFIFPD